MTPRSIAAFAVGPLGGALLGVITIPVITWFFPQEDVGRMAMLQVAVGFSTLFFSLGMDQAYVREFHEADNKAALFKNAVLPGMCLLFTVLLIGLAFGNTFSDWLFGIPEWHLTLLVALTLLTTYLSRFLSLILRMKERGLAYSMSQLLPKLILLAIIGAYVLLDAKKDLTNLLLANTAAVVLVCTFFAFNTHRDWGASLLESLEVRRVKQMLSFGLPLIFSGLAFWSLTAVDKIFLRNLATFEELGLYSVAVSVASAAAVLKAVFSTVWAPTVYKWISDGEKLDNLERVVRFVLLFVVLIFCLTGMFSGLIIFILPDDYVEVRWILAACVALPLFHLLSEATAVGIGITRKTGYAMVAPLAALTVNIVGNVFLIPIFGAAGAAASTSISFFVFFVVRSEVSAFLWRLDNRTTLYGYAVICAAGSVTGALAGSSLDVWLYAYWSLVFVSLFYVFRLEIRMSYQWILKQCQNEQKG